MQTNHVKSSHTLSAPQFENTKKNLLTSQSNPSKPSHAPTPGIRDPSNYLSHVGPSTPILHETHQNPPSSQPLDSPNDQFSIFTDEFQSKFYELFKTFTHGRPTQAKYQTTLEAIYSLVSWRHQNLSSKQPAKGNFNFKHCSSSYSKCIDELCNNSAPFLNATKEEFYITSSIFKMPIYEQVTAPKIPISLPFSPVPSIHNEKHPETHFVCHLMYMSQPISLTITAWPKVIAASVSATVDEFSIPKPPVPPQAQIDEVYIYLGMISYFEGLKRPSISPMELISMACPSPSGSNNAEESYNISSDSDQHLKIFQDLILDVIICYVILEAQASLDSVSPNHTEQSKHVKKRKALHSNNQISLVIIHAAPQVVTSNSDNDFQVETEKKKLIEYHIRHNSVPFVYYLILGVKGLFTAQKDPWNFSISNAMLILSSFHLIHKHVKPPSRHQLAQHLTGDFLNQ
ncbi:hypothetical protein O181_110280 [Austropuccinia psidii MF-1]|uniref:Uncharacterized protein n=1 Tax=Austropuccinia psidii MF-1 TaxID=1389203 RepID=A0A9Q3K026_9BASI|nr:hypothetical protein [Austropuccinia psidii MF-1]